MVDIPVVREDSPLVSIITVTYNAEKFLEDAIKSVVNQTYDNIEYIIIDGGSTDSTVDIIKKYQKHIKYWISEVDNGVYQAMNKGINTSNGSWIMFLGADDYLINSHTIENIVNNLSPTLMLAYGDVLYDNGYRFHSRLTGALLISNSIHHQGAIYNKKLFNNFKYDESCKVYSDYELNLTIYVHRYESFYMNKVISCCACGGLSDTSKYLAKSEIKYIRRKHITTLYSTLLDLIMETALILAKIKRIVKII